MCAFVALDLVFFPYQAKRLAWGNVSEMTRFVSSGMYNRSSITHTHTHTRLMALFPGLPRWAGTRKVKPIWIY